MDLSLVTYFHVVFTLPQAMNRLCMIYPREIYNLLFAVSWDVIRTFAGDEKHLGAETGMFAILHTWGQNLLTSSTPSLRGSGRRMDQSGVTWKSTRSKGRYLFSVKVMSSVYRALFVSALRALIKEKQWPMPEKEFFDELFRHQWVVYAKRPFIGPGQVIEYLGRYTHKIAISNHRLRRIADNTVSFNWKDYRESGRK